MQETRHIEVQLRDGTRRGCTLEVAYGLSQRLPCTLAFSGLEVAVPKFAAIDVWECFCKLREELAKIGAIPLCMGARVDVSPSGMSRSMSDGRIAYITRMGQRGQLEDRVNIFDAAPPETVGSIAQQKEFHHQWIQSFQNPANPSVIS